MRSSTRLSSGMVSWYYALQVPWYIHTYIHTYITHISSNRCFQSHAPMVFFCVFQNKYSHGFNAAEMQGANQTLCLLPGMYVCMYVFIRILPAGWEACQFIQSMHDSVSDTETAVILYLIHWLMVMILIILISFFLTIPLSYSNPESISSSSSLLLLRFDCNHMHFAEHYHTKFHPMSVVGEITVNKQTSSAI